MIVAEKTFKRDTLLFMFSVNSVYNDTLLDSCGDSPLFFPVNSVLSVVKDFFIFHDGLTSNAHKKLNRPFVL